jgi:hypothetical protein
MVKGDGNKVKVALFVRLEAKPGKEADVENSFLAACRSFKKNQRRLPGTGSNWGPRRSVTSTRSQTRRAGKPTFRAKSRRR